MGIEGNLNCASPIFSRYTGAYSLLWASIDAHSEGGLIRICVVVHHQWQLEFIEPGAFHCDTNQAPGFCGHEIDLMRRGKLSGTDQIPFVFTIFIVYHHHAGPFPYRLERFFDRIELNFKAFGS
jgi:hypothetical protein